MPDFITQTELAKRLDVTTRWVRELKEMPRGPKGYPWPECLHWYIEHQATRLASQEETTDVAALEMRKLEAEVRMAELKLAQAEGRLLSIEDLETELSAPLYRIRVRLLNLPTRGAPLLVGCETLQQARACLEELVHEILEELGTLGEDAADEADAA